MEEYQTKLLKANKKPATVNRNIATIKHMFTKAVEWELVDEETYKRIQKVKLLAENNRRLRYLSGEECASLVSALPARIRPIVITVLSTGMRKGEILSLQWEKNIDLKNGLILLEVTKNGDRRECPINETLKNCLGKLVRHITSPYVFVNENGERVKDIKRAFNSALRKVGIKDFHFHDLRHTFASQLVMGGVDLTTVKELLGHKTLTMTLRYAHLAPGHKLDAVEKLNWLISSETSKFHKAALAESDTAIRAVK